MAKKICIIMFLFLLIPIFVFADEEFEDSGLSDLEINNVIETSVEATNIPEINARHSVVIDRLSKQILFGKNECEKCKMASTTKIMTCIVVLENSSLNDIVTVSSKAAHTGGSTLGISTNDKITVENLLYGLMLCSGNDAAVALAEHISGDTSSFADLMNKKAQDLKLSNTHFVTPHGLDEDEHYTTAYDLAILTDYALQNETFARIVKTKTITININGSMRTLSNTNELLGNFDGIYGVKTGFTNGANRCLVTSCKRNDLDVICVVLGCDTKKFRTSDSIKLLNYVFTNFKVIDIEEIIDSDFAKWNLLHSNSFTINKGISQILEMYLDKTNMSYSQMAININDVNKINIDISYSSYYEAPLPLNTEIGTLEFKVGEKILFSLKILNYNEIAKRSTFWYFSYMIKNFHLFGEAYVI